MAISINHMERLISLREAARIFGLSERYLRELISEGKIKAAILPNGEIGVSASSNPSSLDVLNSRLRDISRKLFSHLDHSWITVSDAEKKFSISNATLRVWLKQRYLRIDSNTYPARINEGDVAYCVAIYNERKNAGLKTGAPLLDEGGKPYLLKHPNLSEYRRRRKESLFS